MKKTNETAERKSEVLSPKKRAASSASKVAKPTSAIGRFISSEAPPFIRSFPSGGLFPFKERKRIQINDILSVYCIALSQHTRASHNVSAELLDQAFNGSQGFACADHIVHNENPLAVEILVIVFGEDKASARDRW